MKIIVDEAIPFFKGRLPENVDVVALPSKNITPESIRNADALIVRTRTQCNPALLKDSSVRLVVTATIGTDHIDIQWCNDNGIEIRNAPGCNAPGVAQYVLASLFRLDFNPQKHTLGVIGYGNVGKIVVDWARQIGIKVFVSDPPLKAAGNNDEDYLDLDKLFRVCDAVTLHVPLTKIGQFPTYKMIGSQQLEMMKPGAILVNSSRGGVVDEKALKKSLRNGSLKAVLDVWENEPGIDPELLNLVRISTPHIAGYSAEGKKRATRMALEALSDFLGITVDLKGLECLPSPNKKISTQLITDSYNPDFDSCQLKKDITSFEKLRNEYPYRHEPLFNDDTHL